MNKNKGLGTGHLAMAKAQNIPVSTKHSVEISRHLRYKKTAFAKSFLEGVIRLKKAVPYYRFDQDLGHKAGMSAGRFPQKAAKEFLRLIKSVEANAQSKGLNSSALKITKILANKASIPLTGGRHRRGTKRTHLEIEVREISGKKEKREATVDKSKSGQPKSEPKKTVEVIRKEESGQHLSGQHTNEHHTDEHHTGSHHTAGQPTMAGKAAESVPEAVKAAPKNLTVKQEESHQIIPEEKKETKVAVKTEPQSEISKTEPKTEYHFQSKPQFKPQSVSPPQPEQKFNVNLNNANTKSVGQTTTQTTKRFEEPSSAELLRRAQERAAQLNNHQKEEQKRVTEVNEVENLFEQLKQKGSLRNQTGGRKR